MCAMYKQTRNRDNEMECDEEWTRKGLYSTLSPHAPLHLQSSVHCKFDAWHFFWRLLPFLHCSRSQHAVDASVSSVQKGFHLESDVSHPQSAGLGRAGTGPEPVTSHILICKPRVAHVAAMPLWLVGCSPLSDNLVRTTLSILH